jgi:ribosome maturation protein SDO1
MSSKITTARLVIEGEKFEVLVKPDPALKFKLGKGGDIRNILVVDEIYSDAGKGNRASTEKLKKYFATTDVIKVAETILKKGDLQLTTEQRRRMINDKKKQIIQIISKNYVDPKTKLPHPPLRIEQALSEVRASIDPFKSAEEQVEAIVDSLRRILPLKSEIVKLMIKVPPQYAPQAVGVIRSFGEPKKEEWGFDGSLIVVMEVTIGVQKALLEKLGSVTKGSAQATVIS